MGGGASTGNSDEEIKHIIRKDLSRARKLMHEVTNEKCPVLFSSDTPDKEDFRRMLKVPGVEYDHATADADELVEIIGKLKEKYPDGDGIALACHGPSSSGNSGEFEWSISRKIVVKSADDVKEGTPAFKVLSALGNAVGDGKTVDLFSCELLKTDIGKAVFKAIEENTNCNFAASSDLTGNPAQGGDWIMESDGVNVKDVYFTETDTFTGTFFRRRGPVWHLGQEGVYVEGRLCASFSEERFTMAMESGRPEEFLSDDEFELVFLIGTDGRVCEKEELAAMDPFLQRRMKRMAGFRVREPSTVAHEAVYKANR